MWGTDSGEEHLMKRPLFNIAAGVGAYRSILPESLSQNFISTRELQTMPHPWMTA